MNDLPRRTVFSEDHDAFRDMVRSFIDKEVTPSYLAWERAGLVDRELFRAAGSVGMLLTGTPTEFGGAGVEDWRFSAVVDEEFARAGLPSVGLGFALQNDVAAPYFLELTDDEQKKRWLPGLTSGESIAAVAMTEPAASSDLAGIKTTARRDGTDYVLNGSKTFITNGQNADLVVVAARTSADRHRGLTLLIVERGMPGFERGQNLDKLGLHGQDTSELFFTDVRVPEANRLGAEDGQGFYQLVRNLPQERLSLAVMAAAAAEGVLAETLDYVKGRKAFGRSVGSFQNSRFILAELQTELDIARIYVDHCIKLHSRRELTAVQAAKAKLWVSDLQFKVADRCLQLHGGYGYIREYPVARSFVDSRVQSIYGGTNEIMREIIGRDMGLN
ncbi:acyl-CoA dehydrogenase family protein [Rhodococcus opacus]|uniref:Acyl-CoA dehydrogenase family protein n=1 Tax=Rhodococcus opacus TaxID=37919 RepID=A0AAX3YSQ0_RHOOP|nr:acyl-CoA dehydrogenase family protein [Rhodococcus opacus]MCZ4590206.1 acyl-CoA dehydrogenase family protein [Rhodococcus opacus]WLF52311.1 acyl-CoA dehydrogenase family protein [Rhodococcus opacus]